jgi:glucosamine kinase
MKPDGTCTDVFVGGPANIFSGGDAALQNIQDAAYRAINAIAPNVSLAQVKPQVVAVLGLAGAVEIGASERIKHLLGFGSINVVGDVEVALNGAFQSNNGVMSAIGTGTVHAAKLDGTMRRAGGYGFLLGDEGGGAWMGRELLSHALHARDGLIPVSDLTNEIWSEMGDLGSLLTFARHATPADFGAFAPRIIAAEQAADSTAKLIVDQAASWIVRSVESLQSSGGTMPVAFTGGLGPFFANRLADHWLITQPLGSALDGALWMARQVAA